MVFLRKFPEVLPTFTGLSGLLCTVMGAITPPPASAGQPSSPVTVELRCEGRRNPVGIDRTSPVLRWRIDSARRGVKQTAYHVVAATDPALLEPEKADLWDSGEISSDASIQIVYGGRPLASNQRVWWRVRIWDDKQQASQWSDPASWTMGLLSPADWKATWIGSGVDLITSGMPPGQHRPLPIFRREFDVRRTVRQATLHVCGLGQHDLYLNGESVGQQFLDPPWSEYEKTCFYASHDVTAELRPGRHTLGIVLGKGWLHNAGNRRVHGRVFDRPLALIAQLDVLYDNGTTESVTSDPSWKWTEGPITHDAIVAGTDYDARRLPAGWWETGFDDSQWQPAVAGAGPGGRLTARMSPPLQTYKRFSPRSVRQVEPGVFFYDFGQNASAVPFLRVSGPEGKSVRILYAEQRHGSTPGRNDGKGRVNPAGIGSPAASYLQYTLKGGGEESWLPRTFYTGFQYLEVTGAVPEGHPNPQNLPVIHELTSVHVRSSAEPAGTFACSNSLINDIDRMIDWAVRSNMSHVLTDCPHREKLGWLEVSYLMGPSIAFRYDWSGFGPKIARDIRDTQAPDGAIYTIAPDYGGFVDGFRYTPEWGAAGVHVPWLVWRWYGDRRVLEENFNCMKRFVDYMRDTSTDLVPKAGLGDWYDYGHGEPLGPSRFTPTDLTAMATFHDCARVVAQAAGVLGRTEDEKAYDALARQVAEAFNRKYFNGEDEYSNSGSCQTANAIALCSGLVEPSRRPAVLARTVEDLQSRNWQQTSGDVGHVYLIRALAEGGHHAALFNVLNRTELGSYGHLARNGWSSLPEAWNAHSGSSMNHCMLGHIQEWLHQWVGGIQPGEDSVAFKTFTIRPEPVGDLTSASATHLSPYGLVESSWKLEDDQFHLEVTVPPNTTARVHFPTGPDIHESSMKAAEAEGIRQLEPCNGRPVLEIGSGRYSFRAKRL